MPILRYIKPAVPIRVSEPPTGENWLHEIKWDGWRCQIIKDDDGIRVYARRGANWTRRLPGIVEAAEAIKADNFIIDGELFGVAADDFHSIPTAIRRHEVCVVAFDIVYLNGEDTRHIALEKRRALLKGILLGRLPIIVSQVFHDGEVLLKSVEVRGLEGIVS